MKVKILKTTLGSNNGYKVETFEEGKIYDTDKKEISLELANAWTLRNIAEFVGNKEIKAKSIKNLINKSIDNIENKSNPHKDDKEVRIALKVEKKSKKNKKT